VLRKVKERRIRGKNPLLHNQFPFEEENIKGEFKRGEAPLQRKPSPSSYQGEGDKGDGVLNKNLNGLRLINNLCGRLKCVCP